MRFRNGGFHSSMQKRHILIDFCTNFTGKIKSILKLAMLVNFQLNFSTKFTGKIKSILKLAMLCMFCEPETESPTPACKTCRSHFIGTKFTEKIKNYIETRDVKHVVWARNGGSHFSRKNMRVTFQLILSTKFTEKIKVFWACDAGQIQIDF